MNALENYKAPTPVKWRKIGDAILLSTTSLSGMIMGLPISEHKQLWAIFILNAIGVGGKVITNFFREDEKQG
jgi:hypothetical protein